MTETYEVEPIESSSTELAKVMNEGDPEVMLAILEKKAELAPRWNKAINTILVTQTFPEDWTIQGDGDKAKACLSSAGAERVARLFNITFFEQKHHKEDINDSQGRGYRYVYECKATMGDRSVFAHGAYGTRDKFLGYASGEWRPVESINENNIRNAAYHICIGNAIKALLGLRGIPASRFKEIMGGAGENASKATGVQRGSGTQGGTSRTDTDLQRELAEICIAIANAGATVEKGDNGYWNAVPMGEGDDRDEIARAKEICCLISSFKGKDGSEVNGLPASQLKGKRLEVTLGTARKIREHM